MNLQISPIGAGLIAGYSVVVLLVVAWPLSRLLRKWRWRWLLIGPLVFPLLAAPWAEEVWIAWHYAQACKDAGVHVYRRVKVDGFYDDTGPGGYEMMERYGYSFMEDRQNVGNRIERIERVDGRLKVTNIAHPTARYHYQYAQLPTPYVIEEPVGWKLQKVETQVVDVQTNLVLGRKVTYTRFPNTADWQWMRFFGRGGRSCPDSEKGPFQPEFPRVVLIPIGR